MTRNLATFFASMALVASGCIGAYDPPSNSATGTGGGSSTGGGGSGGSTGGGSTGGGSMTPPPTSAKSLFDANVAPIIEAKCAQAACHGGTGSNPPPFAAGGQANLYNQVLNFASILVGNFDPNQAQILLKIQSGNHNGATYTQAEASSITAWLNAEQAARANGGGTTSKADALLAKFSGCMVQSEFDTAGVAQAWAQKTTDTTNTACQQCHVQAQGFLANADSTRTFQILTTQPNPKGGWFLEYYFTVDTTDPNNPKMIINRDLITRAANGTGQHELFNVDTDRNGNNPSAYQRLQTFFDQTMTHLNANTCGPPKLGT
jgi:hypothetical protein